MIAANATVRAERLEDYAQIAEVHRAAFGRDDEARLVAKIRHGAGFDPALSQVAERTAIDRPAGIVGHVLFSPISIDSESGSTPALALAPMAVLPEHQKRGIGSQLVVAGLEACRRAGHTIVIVVGHPAFYPRFGFEPAGAFGMECPFPVAPEAFMALGLRRGALDGMAGRVRYPACFSSE